MKKLVLVVFSILIAGTIVIGQQETNNTEKKVFENNCASCHTGGFKGWLSGAPKIGDTDAWEKYFENDLPVLKQHVLEGTKKHKVKGGCKKCTEEQIQSAVEYIISETKE